MDLERCLARIGYSGPREPGPDSLAALQQAFLRHVPFENLDIHLGRSIRLAPRRFHDKIVGAGRGGFCYECNGLFRFVLESLGFEVDYLSAAMLLEHSVPMEFGHMVLRVRLDADYLVDVGNGQSCLEPLRLDGGGAASEGIDYEVRPHERGYALFYRAVGEDWKPRYRFTAVPRRLRDFAGLCAWHQSSPQSRFTRHRLASIARPGGRATLLDRELTVTAGTETEVRRLADAGEYGRVLREYFGIELPRADVESLFDAAPAPA